MFSRSAILFLLCLPVLTSLSWGQQQEAQRVSKTFSVNNKPVTASLVQINNRIYVALEDVATALNGSVTSDATKLNLNVPITATTSASANVAANVSTGSIKGTFTYYFNENYGSRPDVGAEVWVVREEALNISENSFVFTHGSDGLKIVGAEKLAKELKALAHAVADGNGSITIPNLPTGNYTLVSKSSHARGGAGMRDEGGRILTKPLTIAAGQVVDVSVDFGTSSY